MLFDLFTTNRDWDIGPPLPQDHCGKTTMEVNTMITGKWYVSTLCAVILSLGWVRAWADPPPQFPQDATFTTIATLPQAIEGLTGDSVNNLYTGGTGNAPCPIWQINLHTFVDDGGRAKPRPVEGPAPSQASLSMPLEIFTRPMVPLAGFIS